MKYVINFIAGPSVGKSLISALVYTELKKNRVKVEYIQEYAKSLVWCKKFDKLNNQYYVSTKQYEIIKSLYSVPDIEYIVLDGSLLLGLYYNRSFPTNVSNIEKTEKMILEKNSEFNHIYIYLERNVNIPFDPSGRVHNEEESKIADYCLKKILSESNYNFKVFKSDINSIQDIIEYINSFGQPEHERHPASKLQTIGSRFDSSTDS